MDVHLWAWGALAGLVLLLLAFDLAVFGRNAEEISFRGAAAWSIGWTVLGVGFAGLLWAWQGKVAADEYLAGFLIEKSLSLDNLFVFALIFGYFATPPALQRRALFWGIVGAVVLRFAFILAGGALLDAFHYTTYVFGAFLVVTGIRMLRHSDVEIDPERNPALRALRRVVPLTPGYHGNRLFVRERGRRYATPMLAALILIATFDVVFAVDSIPAIFAVTRETFIVFAANAFSLLGLSALYFVLTGLMGRFVYLGVGLGAILVFVGAKMGVADVVEVPMSVSMGVIVGTLAVAIAASLVRTRRGRTVRGAPDPAPIEGR